MKSLLLRLFAPGYVENRPEDAPGTYRTEAFTFSAFGPRLVRRERLVKGLRAAYEKVRWDALVVDWNYPDHDGMVGVGWGITRVQDEVYK